MQLTSKIRVFRSAREMEQARALWEAILAERPRTIFQDFEWNLLAARIFAGREEPFVICAESTNGVAIVPAVLRVADHSLRLLGEELFDYRCFLHLGDDKALWDALGVFKQLHCRLEITAIRAEDCESMMDAMALVPFCAAPFVDCAAPSPETFAAAHPRLARNLRRLNRLGFEVRSYAGDNTQLLRWIYQQKAGQLSTSLFHDQMRVDFMLAAAQACPERFSIFTLEDERRIAAALVTLRDAGWRRFYTGWFDPQWAKHSPSLSLIYEITGRSLAEGLHCDYMTGEQPYKLRLATGAMPLFRLQASVEQVRRFGTTGLRAAV